VISRFGFHSISTDSKCVTSWFWIRWKRKQTLMIHKRYLRIVSRLVDNNANLHFTPWGIRSVIIMSFTLKSKRCFCQFLRYVWHCLSTSSSWHSINHLCHDSKTRGRDTAESCKEECQFGIDRKHVNYRSFTIYFKIIRCSIYLFVIISTFINWMTFESKLQYGDWSNWSCLMHRNLHFINILILLKIKMRSSLVIKTKWRFNHYSKN